MVKQKAGSPSRLMLINADEPEEVRVALVEKGKLEEFYIETAAQGQTRGNIYKGIVCDIVPSLQAVFVDYGATKRGFLQIDEIHPEYFLSPAKGKPLVERVLKPGQEILVQVIKEETLHKGAALTTYLALPGRYLVLTPGQENVGISRKITDEKDRKRLKEIINSFSLLPGVGVIVRTAAAGKTKLELARDLRYLLRLWETIKKKAQSVPAPALIYQEVDLLLRAIRDYFSADVREIWVDNEEAYRKVKEFMRLVSPRHGRVVKRYKQALPIFTHFGLDDQIAQIYQDVVSLPSGGEIVIQTTEALTAIDVNSASTQEKNLEQTSFKTNLEAAEESARQIRLRDIAGLIVIDFIQMRDKKHLLKIEKQLREALKKDRARVDCTKMSKFGLIEISRQRLHPSLIAITTCPCPLCEGRGFIMSTEVRALETLRRIKMEIALTHPEQITCKLPLDVANYLLNKKRRILTELERHFRIKLLLVAEPSLKPYEVRCETSAKDFTGEKACPKEGFT
ncbi:MAG: Rne/Rng family ribonuclease [Candidatus Desulfofervidaceae bacterium]|nr:Rne/Rng family ribonuclease [Candidatus Desulfofervidaceae bacterium]